MSSGNISGRPRSRTLDAAGELVEEALDSLPVCRRPRSQTLEAGSDGAEPCMTQADTYDMSGGTTSSAYPHMPGSGYASQGSTSSQAKPETTLSTAVPASQLELDAKPNPAVTARKNGKKKTVGFGKRYSQAEDGAQVHPEGRRISEVEAQKKVETIQRFQEERRMLGLDEEECMDSQDLFGRPLSRSLDAACDGDNLNQLEISCGRPRSQTLDTGSSEVQDSQDFLPGRQRSRTLDTGCDDEHSMRNNKFGQLPLQTLDEILNEVDSAQENSCRRPRSRTLDLGCDAAEDSLDCLCQRPCSQTLDGRRPPSRQAGTLEDFLSLESSKDVGQAQCLHEFLQAGAPVESLDQFLSPN